MMKGTDTRQFQPAGKRIEVSVGESVRILRELQEIDRERLSELTGIPRDTLSAIEDDRMELNMERAKVLARALECHPGVFAGSHAPCGQELDCGVPAPYLVPEQTTGNRPNETQPLQKSTAGLSH